MIDRMLSFLMMTSFLAGGLFGMAMYADPVYGIHACIASGLGLSIMYIRRKMHMPRRKISPWPPIRLKTWNRC